MASSSRNEILAGAGGGEEEIGVMLVPYKSVNKIQKVPSFLLSNSKGNYDHAPKVISLGPYHYGKPVCQLLEGFKRNVFHNFIISGSHSRQRDANFYRKKVLQVVDEARRCYVEGSTDKFDDLQFAEMMIFDACFLLYYMTKEVFDDFWSSTTIQWLEQIGQSCAFYVQLDMYLLENQIPLWIAEFLFNAQFGTTISWKQLLVYHCQRNWYGGNKYRVDDDDDDDRDYKPLHLLEAFHNHMVTKSSSADQKVSLSRHSSAVFLSPEKNSTVLMSQIEAFEKYSYVFRSVMDLKSKGIHFGHSDDIYSVGMGSVKFESYYVYAKLKLPIWYVSPESRIFFANMIAYELCPESSTQLEITSYINFMKSLIVCPSDVKELREKRIIFNTLGDDMEVVQLFKGLNTHGIDNPDIFLNVKKKIQEHYDSKAKTWIAEFVYTHLRSPWAIMALLAASLLLLLTIAQTYAAFNSRN